jgi:hypothetical protein
MKPITASNSAIMRRLIDVGIVPQLATKFSLTLTANVNEPIRMTSECFVTEEQFREIADALIENPEEAKRIAHTTVLKSQVSGETLSIDLPSDTVSYALLHHKPGCYCSICSARK